ncbi:hypothetical protein HMPREF3190_00177 [Umbribacter vaginalis]|nr:hypothetical protein HMPREF3190_00177 [Coriobacteriales bacterium DNF00809]
MRARVQSLWNIPEVCAWPFAIVPVRTHSLSFTYIRKPYG